MNKALRVRKSDQLIYFSSHVEGRGGTTFPARERGVYIVFGTTQSAIFQGQSGTS